MFFPPKSTADISIYIKKEKEEIIVMLVCTFLCLHVTSLCDMANCQWCVRIIVITDGFHVTVLLCGHTSTGLVQCCQHHLIGYYTSSLEKSHSLLFYRRILMVAIMVKSFKDISINIKTFNFFFLAEFIIFFFQFGFKGIIVLSGN